MSREDRKDMKRGPYIRESTYEELRDLTDVTGENVRDTLDEIILMTAAFNSDQRSYEKLEKLSENTERDKGDIIAEMIRVSVNSSGEIINNPMKARMD